MRSASRGPERLHAAHDFARDRNQLCELLFGDLENAFVFAAVPEPVAAVEDLPFRVFELQRVLERLEYEIAVLRAVAVPSKRSERKRMHRVN